MSNLSAIHWDPVTIGLSAIALGLGIWILHRFIRAFTGTAWTPRRTIICSGIFLFTTGAAIAMTGIVHELVWLTRSPIIENRRGYNRSMAISNAKQIGLCLIEMQCEDRPFPKTMDEVAAYILESGGDTQILHNPTRHSGQHEQYVFLQPGVSPDDLQSDTPILAGFGYADNRCVVLRADCSVKLMHLEEFEEAMAQASP